MRRCSKPRQLRTDSDASSGQPGRRKPVGLACADPPMGKWHEHVVGAGRRILSTSLMVATVRPRAPRSCIWAISGSLCVHVGTQGDPFRGDGGTHSPDVASRMSRSISTSGVSIRNARHKFSSASDTSSALRINRSTYFMTTSIPEVHLLPPQRDPLACQLPGRRDHETQTSPTVGAEPETAEKPVDGDRAHDI